MKNYIVIPLLLFGMIVFSQKKSTHKKDSITIKGITTYITDCETTERLDDVSIYVYEYNDQTTMYCTDERGKFEFAIPKNTYIVLVFEKYNFIAKRILFDTRTDKKTRAIKPFDLEIVMLNYVDGVNYDDLDFPITRVEYMEEINDFNYVEKYTESMLKNQEKVITKLARN